jgi:DNA-binding GntR family transcriptional regulator
LSGSLGVDSLSAFSLNLSQLNEQVYELLKREILGGNLVSGQRLSVEDLSQRLGISPTPIRDALRNLSQEGLVQVNPRRGSFVAEFSRSNVREVFQIRRIIECAAADMPASALRAAAQAMRPLVTEMGALVVGERFSDYARFNALDAQMHHALVGLLQNRRLSDFYEKLRWPVQVVLGLSQSSYQRAGQTLAEHFAIVDAFEAQDAAQARQAIAQHLLNAEADLIERMPPE